MSGWNTEGARWELAIARAGTPKVFNHPAQGWREAPTLGLQCKMTNAEGVESSRSRTLSASGVLPAPSVEVSGSDVTTGMCLMFSALVLGGTRRRSAASALASA
jgi:hypothetical protein